MATYKKTGGKIKKTQQVVEEQSTTAEVFNTLDETASKSEQWVIKNQKIIFILLGLVVAGILGYLAYNKFVAAPKEKEAANELAFPKTYFEKAMTSSVAVDSLLTLGLDGTDGKYGFVDIADKFSGTSAGNLANYYAGLSYLKMSNYKEAISHLQKFTSEDELLAPTAKGAIGDAFADINQPEDALDYYLEAANLRDNNFSTPLFLFKAGNTAMELEKYSKALDAFSRIKKDYPTSNEARNIDIYINKATFAKN
ncbi:Tetratricopeptide repeat-containing protein [Lutibacter oricola]|uniref:Tetratricopeptide repeat-containing protein n=1 Tax=Lutibacter oricola TaxID=762486 RepID=A0A1H3F2W8_9FLAO|nr:tetratricopeptide repeat protein [Lutibacter oricola]SDX84534.1 Tetratricopeptide repeat-containing protein [Lutibacter oricola]